MLYIRIWPVPKKFKNRDTLPWEGVGVYRQPDKLGRPSAAGGAWDGRARGRRGRRMVVVVELGRGKRRSNLGIPLDFLVEPSMTVSLTWRRNIPPLGARKEVVKERVAGAPEVEVVVVGSLLHIQILLPGHRASADEDGRRVAGR